MKILLLTLEVIATYLEMYITFNSLSIVFSFKREERSKIYYLILCPLIAAGIILAINSVDLSSMLSFFVGMFILISSAVYLFKCTPLQAFSVVLCAAMCIYLLDFIVFSSIGLIFNDSSYVRVAASEIGIPRAMSIIVGKSLLVILYSILKKFMKNQEINYAYIKYLAYISLFGFVIIIYLTRVTLDSLSADTTLNWLFLLIIIVLFFVVIGYNIKQTKKEEMNKMIELKNSILEENLKSMNQAYSVNARNFHDLNNHINVLYQLIINKEEDQALQYIEELRSPVTELSRKTWSGDKIIDFILNYKILEMEKNSIQYDINVEFPQTTQIKPNDICSILANLLDNAIEASIKVQDEDLRKIDITIRRINNMIIIKIVNNIQEMPRKKSNKLITTKKNKKNHGLGLKSVEHTANKYDGVVQFNYDDKSFTVTATLYY